MTISADELEAIRRTRRHPRPTQFDYLHVRQLVSDIQAALGQLDGDGTEALDVYCGSRPYEDLLPPGSRSTGLDVEGNPYGIADVVSNEFLPFDDASFDLVTCYEAFHYVEDPDRGIAEIRRVLRPGGVVLITVPFVWEYDRSILEHRYTGPELAALFEGWEDVRVVENGGRAVAWATLTGSMLESAKKRLPRVVRAVFPLVYVGLNGVGAGLATLEQRNHGRTTTLPMNLLVIARRPAGG